MAPQADGFLVHGNLIGKNGGFRQNTAFVNGSGLQHLLHTRRQLLTIGCYRLRRALLHLAHHRLNGGNAACNILAQLDALHGPHGVVGFQRLVQHGADIAGDRLQILLRLGDGQHIREFGKHSGGQFTLQ